MHANVFNLLNKDVTGTLVATEASGLTGAYQELRPLAGELCCMCAGAPAPAGGQKSASVSTLEDVISIVTCSQKLSYGWW